MPHSSIQPAALPPETLAKLLPKLHSVPLLLHEVLHAPDSVIEATYFPETGFVSLVADLEDGSRAEVGVVAARA